MREAFLEIATDIKNVINATDIMGHELGIDVSAPFDDFPRLFGRKIAAKSRVERRYTVCLEQHFDLRRFEFLTKMCIFSHDFHICFRSL